MTAFFVQLTPTTPEDDPNTSALNAKALNDLGTIRVQCEAVTTRAAEYSQNSIALPGDVPVSEKAKKAGAHAARCGFVACLLCDTYC